MPPSEPPRNPALAYWPQIEYAAANHLPTAELWDAIKAAASELGLERPGVSPMHVNSLRSMATTIQANSARLERLDPSFGIDGRLVSEAPWSRPLKQRNALPMHQVRYQHTINGPNGTETAWRTSALRGALPRTMGELLEAINEDAEYLADKYGGEHVGITGLQLLVV